MRVIVYGAGAIGGAIGSRLFQHGFDVVLVARGAHLDQIRAHGLTLQTPLESVTLAVPAVGTIGEISPRDDDVVVLAVKSQDTIVALEAIGASVPSSTPIVCAQNGVENERVALRRFSRVYAMCVMCPATHLEAGIVQASSAPVTGLLDIGCWPTGVDGVANEVAAALADSTFSSIARSDIARWKYGKLLMNLGNAVEALCGRDDPGAGELVQRAHAEGVECLRAAGIDFVDADEDAARRAGLLTPHPIAGVRRGGGSTWQSLSRRTGSIETDYLTGEVVLLGRLHSVPTPANEVLQRLVAEMARARALPGTMRAAEVLAQL